MNWDTDVEQGSLEGDAKGVTKASWNTSESRLADDSSSEEVDHTTAGWESKGPERGCEIRIEVNRTVVQSSAVGLPEETAGLQSNPLSPPPRHTDRRDQA